MKAEDGDHLKSFLCDLSPWTPTLGRTAAEDRLLLSSCNADLH